MWSDSLFYLFFALLVNSRVSLRLSILADTAGEISGGKAEQ
jgi:hypothetical protein